MTIRSKIIKSNLKFLITTNVALNRFKIQTPSNLLFRITLIPITEPIIFTKNDIISNVITIRKIAAILIHPTIQTK